jgi:hypothetical protein
MRFQVAVQLADRPSKGRWFTAELQDWYRARVAEVRRHDELAAQKKAEEDKRMAEWTAQREKERLEEEAKAEHERVLAERAAAQVAMRAQRKAARRQRIARHPARRTVLQPARDDRGCRRIRANGWRVPVQG